MIKANMKFAAGCLLGMLVSVLLHHWLPIQVFWLCEVFLIVLLGIYFLTAVYQPWMETKRFLQHAVRNREWNNIYENIIWNNMEFHYELEQLIQEMADEEKNKEAAENYEKQAIIQELQSQINPHFLYNTLECIRGQAVLDDHYEIAMMLEALGDFFRYSISRKDPVVTLLDEINNIQNYMQIQNYRFHDRFQFETELDEESLLNCYLPKLTLQPIIENAILHGYANTAGGSILLTAESTEELVIITVSDFGEGMDSDTLHMLNEKIKGNENVQFENGKHGSTIALPNVDKRIKLLFGREYGLTVYSSPYKGTDMEIVLPYMDKKEETFA